MSAVERDTWADPLPADWPTARCPECGAEGSLTTNLLTGMLAHFGTLMFPDPERRARADRIAPISCGAFGCSWRGWGWKVAS